jgi:hypothetical protein
MRPQSAFALLSALPAILAFPVSSDDDVELQARWVDETYPYTGPAVPIGDWVDTTVNGNGKGFPRLVEPPAVTPASKKPTNNINVIALSYVPEGINIHYQTPFGLGEKPAVKWGQSRQDLTSTATGSTVTYVVPAYAHV